MGTTVLRHEDGQVKHGAPGGGSGGDDVTPVASCSEGLRRLKEEALRTIWTNQSLSCLVVEIDGFEAVQREYGPVQSERVIEDVARILSCAVRGIDLVAQLEGPRFLLVTPGANAVGAQGVGKRLLSRLRAHRFVVPDHPSMQATVTIGIASCAGGPASDSSHLLERAIEALARGKARGGDQVVSS